MTHSFPTRRSSDLTEQKSRYKDISLRLSELQTKFEEHLMDAIQAWGKQVDDDATLAGMTDEAKQAARERAKVKELEGYWLTLDFPSYDAVISYADNRAQIGRAHV